MLNSKFEERIYTFTTVIITFVFYCLAIEEIGILNVEVKFALILVSIEFLLAYLSELFLIGSLVNKMFFKEIKPKEYKAFSVRTTVTYTITSLMCLWKSFLAIILYKWYNARNYIVRYKLYNRKIFKTLIRI